MGAVIKLAIYLWVAGYYFFSYVDGESEGSYLLLALLCWCGLHVIYGPGKIATTLRAAHQKS